jgi:hypothetical protein
MSPFMPNLSFKHRRVTKHVRFPSRVDQIYIHQKRGDEESTPTASDIINKSVTSTNAGICLGPHE